MQTTVYRLPCAGFAEKDGTFVNSARWLQWKNAAVPPPGEARARSGHPRAHLPESARALPAAKAALPRADPQPVAGTTPIRSTARSSSSRERSTARRSADSPTRRGQSIAAGQQLPGFAALRDDGTTLCGNWLYSGSWTEAGNQMAAPRHRGSVRPRHLSELGLVVAGQPARALQPRVLRSGGQPWDPERRQVWWNEARGAWVGNDVPDFKADSPPAEHMGPFIMNPEGVGRLFAPLAAFAGRPVSRALRADRKSDRESAASGAVDQSRRREVPRRPSTSTAPPPTGYNIVCTTYRLTEHYHYWTKNNPMNVQLCPSPSSRSRRSSPTSWAWPAASGSRSPAPAAAYIAKAMVTRRIKPMMIDGEEDLSDRHPDPLGLSRHRRGRRTHVTRLGEPAVADRDRPERLHAGVQGLPGQAREGLTMSTGDLQIKAISGQRERGPRARRPAPGRGLQVHRRHHLHRLQGVRGRVRGMERHAVPADDLRQHLPDDAGDVVELLESDQVQRTPGAPTARCSG